jgi:nucleoid DNA-binding protein
MVGAMPRGKQGRFPRVHGPESLESRSFLRSNFDFAGFYGVFATLRVAFLGQSFLIIPFRDGRTAFLTLSLFKEDQVIMAKAASKKPSVKAPTKTEILNNIATASGLSRKEVAAVLDALSEEVKKNLSKKGAGVFAIPGLVKITRQQVPAKPARKNAPDPFNPGQFRDYPAKPATTKVKVRALKNLKDMV